MIFKRLRQALSNRCGKELAEVQPMSKPQPTTRLPLPEIGSLWLAADDEEFSYRTGSSSLHETKIGKGDLALILKAEKSVVTVLLNGQKFLYLEWDFHESFVPLINEEVSDGCK